MSSTSLPAEFDGAKDNLHFESTWTALGPFQIGTREAVWGSDPLAAHGGFSSLQFDPKASFASSLPANGSVGWTEDTYNITSTCSEAIVDIEISHHIDWTRFKDCYGWAAVQFQTWTRGTFVLDAPRKRRLVVYSDQILELVIDGRHYFGGDLFAFRRAPLVLDVSPGEHIVDLRLIRDARASGGAAKIPAIQASLAFRLSPEDVSIEQRHMNFPNIVNGIFCSSYASISLENILDDVVKIINIKSLHGNWVHMRDTMITLLPGQSRPVALELNTDPVNIKSIELIVTYKREAHAKLFTTQAQIPLRFARQDEPHRFTFVHPSGIVSYAIIRPPLQQSIPATTNLPVLVNLHGAGLDADSAQLRASLNDVGNLPAWFLFPSGTTTWSGDDWHHWGWRDVEAAISATTQWCARNNWQGAGPDVHRLMIVGHSNGGQGTYYALSHWPDRIIAAIVASGYMSIQAYVPFQLWREMEPLQMSIIHAAMNFARHELFVSNFKGTPIYLQHGSEDDNVPPFHSRRMHQLLQERQIPTSYSEIESEGHWWTGALVTPGLREFYKAHIQDSASSESLQEFTLVVATTADTGSKNGLKIELLQMPGQLGKVEVVRKEHGFHLRTSNVYQISFPKTWLSKHRLSVDSQQLAIPHADVKSGLIQIARDSSNMWVLLGEVESSKHSASAQNLGGGLHAILRTSGLLSVVATDVFPRRVAVDIARNLYQYFAADVAIVATHEQLADENGNLITIAIGDDLDRGIYPEYPLQVNGRCLTVKKRDGVATFDVSDNAGLGAVFLRPWTNGRLELVVWGSDSDALHHASRLVPTVTGAGQPDFIVQRADCLWKGVEGALALGFFDRLWNITAASYIT